MAGRGPPSGAAWVYMLGFGGGVVSGDVANVSVSAGPGAAGVVSSPSSTKVFAARHDGLAGCAAPRSTWALASSVAPGALLVLAPEPVVLFAHSRWTSRTACACDPDGSAVLVET